MSKDKSFYQYEDRNLSEVFRELQEIKNNAYLHTSYKQPRYHIKKLNVRKLLPFHTNVAIKKISLHHMIIFITIFSFVILFCNKIFAKSYLSEYESNSNVLNIQEIISKNANINTFKRQSTEEYNIVFPTVYHNNPSLPKGEEFITKEGTLGKETVTSVKTYKNRRTCRRSHSI